MLCTSEMNVSSDATFCFPFRNTKLARALDRIDRIVSAIGQGNNLCVRCLGTEQIGREVDGIQRMPDRAENLAAVRNDEIGGRFFKSMTKG